MAKILGKPNVQRVFDVVNEHNNAIGRLVSRRVFAPREFEKVREETRRKFRHLGIEDTFDWSEE